MAKFLRVLVFQYSFRGVRQSDDTMSWDPKSEVIDEMTFGWNWQMPLNIYNKRTNFYTGFEIKGDSDIYPVLEGKIELEVPSLSHPEFTLEMATTPMKLDLDQRTKLVELIEKYLKDDDFRVWWDDDKRGPERNPLRAKKKVLKELQNIPTYDGRDDLTPDKCIITLEEALSYLGFEGGEELPTETEFKNQVRKMQLKLHPDRNGGEEGPFKHLQKCKAIVEEALQA